MKLTIGQILLEEVRFKHRRSDFLSLPGGEQVQSTVNLTIETLNSDSWDSAAVRLRIVSDAPEAPYHFDVSYVVVYEIDFEGAATRPTDFRQRVGVTGATMALPFVRELVANLSSRGRFGPTWIAPTDFSALVQETKVASEAVAAAE